MDIFGHLKKKIRRILKNDLNNLTNKLNSETFGDQKGQVDFLLNYVFDYSKNGLKHDGFFIDLACADGVTINNTYFLEKYLNWSGLLFEANLGYEESITKNRKSKLISKCVSNKLGEKVKFRVDNDMLGGIVSDDTDNNSKYRSKELLSAKIIELETTTLEFELDRNNSPKLIDFLSLDVEGAEYLIMKDFPFDKYKFRCMTIERPNRELDIILALNSYVQVAHLNFDVIYVHKDFLLEVNFNPKTKFQFTASKNW